MLDRDLAELYGVKTKVLKQAVRRNLARFPNDFMFEMSNKEMKNWKSHFVTSKEDRLGLRYAPFCFTEQGVAMLSSVLSSPTAVKVNIQIIRVFTKLRQQLTDTLNLELEIEKIKKKRSYQNNNTDLIFTCLDELVRKKENAEPRKRIGYKSE